MLQILRVVLLVAVHDENNLGIRLIGDKVIKKAET
jgi:hypothetical protein